MWKLFPRPLFNIYFLLLWLVAAARQDNQTDQEALLAFKAKIANDPFRVLNSWNTSTHFCRWHGVTCGRRHKRVIGLNLMDGQLTGSISPYIGNLSFLRSLNLENNSLIQEIPAEFGHLKRLRYLLLQYNFLDGEIPSNLSRCNNLVVLRVAYNRLFGSIPWELGSLSKLDYFRASKNDLTGGIPSSFGNLSSLVKFYVPLNRLSGKIPDVLGRLTKLEVMALGENWFSGRVPPNIYNLSSVRILDLIRNQIEDTLPSDLGITLPNLEYFSIVRNRFSGSIPASLSNASNLEELAFGQNALSGSVPSFGNSYKLRRLSLYDNHLGRGQPNDLNFISSLTNATNMEDLELHFNNFSGQWTNPFRNISSNLRTLHLTRNHIRGSILSELGSLVNLESVRINDNLFTGAMSSDIAKLQKLQFLDLSENRFSGDIPSSIGNLSLLANLFLNKNKFSNSLPSSIGNCQNLVILNLADNNLRGPIPRGVSGLSSLATLDLSHNQLSGSIPGEVGNLKNIEYLNLSRNNLNGKIPSPLGSCVKLEILAMNGNLLQGPIPSSFSSLRGLQILDLSCNNLSGQIPKYLEGFKLLLLNISFNDFDGTVPEEGIFKNTTAISLYGNTKLCGGMPLLHVQRCNSRKSKNYGSRLARVAIPVVSSLLAVTMILCCLYILWLKRIKWMSSLDSTRNSFPRISYQSLFRATNGFSSGNLIGAGSHGSVYKGILDLEDTSTTVAVKVLNLLQSGASKRFIAECEALKNVRHRSLVKILTVCSSIDHRGNEFKALVYEFMTNGNLEEWLHPNPSGEFDHLITRNLSLLQRLSIAIDVASAIDYLHNDCQTPVIHCDLKPSNVLLDNELVGHVGDFGLSKFNPKFAQGFPVHQTSTTVLRGTIGYTPPEYGIGNEISKYGDIYSFGILLLELFTGKRPTDKIFVNGLDLHNYVKNALCNRVEEIVDPILLENQRLKQRHTILECLICVFEVGIDCSKYSTVDRKNIKDVVVELQSARETFLLLPCGETQ